MRNFQLLFSGANVLPILHTLQRKPYLWNRDDVRTKYPQSPHHQADDIILRFNEIPDDLTKIVDDKECRNYPAMQELPVRPILFDLMRMVEGEQLGRVMITRLAPGKQITPHKDEGAPAEFYDRYHIILQNLPGSVFQCGDERVVMKSGDVWHFNNCLEHHVVNNSIDDRISLIADIRPC